MSIRLRRGCRHHESVFCSGHGSKITHHATATVDGQGTMTTVSLLPPTAIIGQPQAEEEWSQGVGPTLPGGTVTQLTWTVSSCRVHCTQQQADLRVLNAGLPAREQCHRALQCHVKPCSGFHSCLSLMSCCAGSIASLCTSVERWSLSPPPFPSRW